MEFSLNTYRRYLDARLKLRRLGYKRETLVPAVNLAIACGFFAEAQRLLGNLADISFDNNWDEVNYLDVLLHDTQQEALSTLDCIQDYA